MQIEINKQPLYGTVYWDGSDFVYTPNTGFTGNDFYIYTKNDNGKISTHTNYVNPTNTLPIALNPVLSADAFITNEYSVSDLVYDNTLPFGSLTISDLSKPLNGTAYTDGSEIYYKSNTYNSLEYLYFKVSDKQFTINASLVLSITNGIIPSTPGTNADGRLISLSSDMTFVSYHSGNWESMYNTLCGNSADWDALDASRYIRMSNEVETMSSDLNLIFLYKDEYDSVVTTVSSYSADWNSVYTHVNDVSSLVSTNSANWETTYETVTSYKNLWDGLSSGIDNLSSEMMELNDEINSTVDTLSLSSFWDSLTINNILTTNAVDWNTVYDFLVLNYKKNNWDDTYTATQQFSTFFVDLKNKFDSTDSTVAANNIYWSDKLASSILSAHSGNWDSVYSLINNISGTWVSLSYESFFNIVSTGSASWNSIYSTVSSSSANWVAGDILLAPVSSYFLTGGPTFNLTTDDLTVYGDTYIKGNLSAFGPKVVINTDVYTASSFEISNAGTNDALIVDKVGYNAVGNFLKDSKSILYVGSNFKTGINTSTPNTDLTVVGDIRASGYVYPLYFEPMNVFAANSAKYEGAYTYTRTNSATINGLTASKIAYDNVNLFISNSSSQIDSAIANKSKYDSMYTMVSSQSARNDTSNNFISVSGYNIDKDPFYRLSATNYDFLVSYVQSTSAASLTGFQLSHVFSTNRVITNQSAYIIVPEDFRIKSWYIYSQTPTNVIIDVLSGTFDSYPTMISLVGNNYPALDTFFHPDKNYAGNLQGHWTTDITKGSILQFNMTNNTSSSAIMIALNVDKL